jgi:methyltransferase family protein
LGQNVTDREFLLWFEALERRHLENLNFSEVRRGVQAVSSLYVERRDRLTSASLFSGAGKRAAFAMFFGPLHFLLIRQIAGALGAQIPEGARILDLGCGTGVAGAAWAKATARQPSVLGIDRNPWVLRECKWTYHKLGIQGTVKNADVSKVRIPAATAVIAAFILNELDLSVRDRFRKEFIRNAASGLPVLIVEPIARRVSSWWEDWATEWKAIGGRADKWRFHVELPERLALMDRAAGLDHRELTGRSLWLPATT